MFVAWTWVKGHLAVVGGVLLSILLGVVAWGAYRRKVDGLKDTIAVERAQREIAGLRARRDAVGERVEENEAEIVDIDRRLVANKRRIVEAREGTRDLTDGAIENAFDRLGY